MDVSRLHRVLRLLTILQSGSSPTVTELVDELGISRRTLYRDLNILEAAGIPYYHEADKGYRLAPSFFLPPVNLKVTEAMGLMMLAKAAAARSDQPLSSEAIQAVRKLVAQVPAGIREICQEMVGRTSVHPGPAAVTTNDGDSYTALQTAIDEHRTVAFQYDSFFEQKLIDVTLDPYHLHYAVRAWYVIGRCKRHKDERTYKLARIRNVEPTKKTFKVDPPFSIDRYLGAAWQMIPEGKVHNIEVVFETKVARNAAEVRWHDSQSHKMLPDGRCRMKFRVDGLNEITWWLLGYGDQVRVVKPAALRNRLVDIYRAALERYEDDA